MENIVEILNGLGIEIGDKSSQLKELVEKNYKTVNEFDKLKTKKETLEADIKSANEQITELGNKVKEFEGTDSTINELKTKIQEYEQKEIERQTREKEEQANAELENNFNEAVKEKKFVNDFTKKAIFNQVKELLEKPENKGKGINEIFENITKDQEGIFASENPGVNLGQSKSVDTKIETTADYIRNKLYNK